MSITIHVQQNPVLGFLLSPRRASGSAFRMTPIVASSLSGVDITSTRSIADTAEIVFDPGQSPAIIQPAPGMTEVIAWVENPPAGHFAERYHRLGYTWTGAMNVPNWTALIIGWVAAVEPTLVAQILVVLDKP